MLMHAMLHNLRKLRMMSLVRFLSGHNFEVVVLKPWLDWAGTEEGDSHLVTLLKVSQIPTNVLVLVRVLLKHSQPFRSCVHLFA